MNVNQQDFNLGNNQLALNPDLVSTVVVNSFLQPSTNLAFYKFPVYPHTYCFTKNLTGSCRRNIGCTKLT